MQATSHPTHGAAPRDIPVDQMERECIFRWGRHEPLTDAFLLSRIPGFETRIHKLINKGVLENGAVTPGIAREHPFSLTVIELPPGKGTGLHAHATEEVFFPLDGDMEFTWGAQGEHNAVLGPWDCISVPTGQMRAFWNRSARTVHLLAIVAGTNAQTKGSVTYHESVIHAAQRSGLKLDARGALVLADGDGPRQRIATLRRLYPLATVEACGDAWQHVDTGGNGPPVVLLPGSQGTCEIYFEQLLALGGSWRMVAATYPAHSDPVRLSDSLAAFLAAKELGPAVVVGSSFAAYWIQVFAQRHPHLVRRLVICNGFVDASEVQAGAFSRDRIEPVPAEQLKAARVAKLAALPDPLRTVLEELMAAGQQPENLKARLVGVARAAPIVAPAIDAARVAIIDCDDDAVITQSMRAAVRDLYAGARRLTLPHGGHFPHVTNAQAYTDGLLSILRQSPDGTPPISSAPGATG